MSHELRHDDPVYYKKSLMGLISEAKENGLEVFTETAVDGTWVYFKCDNGECAGVTIDGRDKDGCKEMR